MATDDIHALSMHLRRNVTHAQSEASTCIASLDSRDTYPPERVSYLVAGQPYCASDLSHHCVAVTDLGPSLDQEQACQNAMEARVGGRPVWLNNEPPPPTSWTTCTGCLRPMSLVLQSGCKLAGSASCSGSQRLLYIFGCDTPKCCGDASAWVAIRGQRSALSGPHRSVHAVPAVPMTHHGGTREALYGPLSDAEDEAWAHAGAGLPYASWEVLAICGLGLCSLVVGSIITLAASYL